jgi:mono/diheme cytochrome c family protein
VPLPRKRRGVSAAALLITVGATTALSAERPARTTRDRIYTAAQAERGKEVYKESCAACHALDFYSGHAMKSWDGGSLSDLYDAISVLMPPGNPGSLKRREYVDILAYILSLNGTPAGDAELPSRAADLKVIRIKWGTKR